MSKTGDIITVFGCFALCMIVGIFTFVLPHQDFSDEENRALADAPILSVDSIMSGKYFSRFSAFFSDHIVMRNAFVRGRTVSELAMGRQEVGGVLFYSDGALVQRGFDASESLLRQNLLAIKSVIAGGTYVIVPRAIDLFGLPMGAGSSEAAVSIREVAYSLCGDGELLFWTLSEKCDERIYYATDHHLTTYGAYLCYEFLGEWLGYEPMARERFEVQTASQDFRGTSYSAAGLISLVSDRVELWRYEGDDEIKVMREGEEIPLYDLSFVHKKDKYRVFLGGNHGILSVAGEGKKPSLLLVKDSYANALIPFLAAHFDITVVDPRYTSITFSELVSGGEYDEILVFCGMDTLSTGNDFARLFR